MAKDYSGNLATVKRLIRDKGRLITLRRLDDASVDSSRPWLSPVDPVATAATVDIYAVSAEPSSLTRLGFSAGQIDLYKDVAQIFICEPGEVDPENLDKYNTVLDGLEEFRISFVEKFRPAYLTLLYFIGVSR